LQPNYPGLPFFSLPLFQRQELVDTGKPRLCVVVTDLGFLTHGATEDFRNTLKVATDENGVFVRTWIGMTTLWRAELVNAVHRMELWLERHFEGGWGADWTLKKLIDQRVSDKKRKRSKKSKLMIYSIIVMISKCNYL
jgi:hypothetical protein